MIQWLRHEDRGEDHEELCAEDAGDADEDEAGDSEGDDGDAGWGDLYLVMMLVHLITFNIFSELYDIRFNYMQANSL